MTSPYDDGWLTGIETPNDAFWRYAEIAAGNPMIVATIRGMVERISAGLAVPEELLARGTPGGAAYALGQVDEVAWRQRIETRAQMSEAVLGELALAITKPRVDVRRAILWRGKQVSGSLYTLTVTGTVSYTFPPLTPGQQREIRVVNAGESASPVGTIRGQRYDQLIVDDPHAPIPVDVPMDRERVERWFREALPMASNAKVARFSEHVRGVLTIATEEATRNFEADLERAVRRERRRRRMRRVRRRGW